MNTKSKSKSVKAEEKPRHIEGSRKGKVHDLFDGQGDGAAFTLGIKLGLKENTLRSWFSQWRRESGLGDARKVKKQTSRRTGRSRRRRQYPQRRRSRRRPHQQLP